MAELVKALQVPDVRIDDVNGVTGDANIFIVRGKKRCVLAAGRRRCGKGREGWARAGGRGQAQGAGRRAPAARVLPRMQL